MLPIINHPDYVAQIGDDHRFPIKKFGELFELLKKDQILSESNLYIPEPVSYEDLLRVHDADYVRKIDELSLSKEEERTLGFPMVSSVKRRSYVATGGTLLSAKLALTHRLACNTAGGSHHAFANMGSGYCVFNDVAVAAKHLIHHGKVKNILICFDSTKMAHFIIINRDIVFVTDNNNWKWFVVVASEFIRFLDNQHALSKTACAVLLCKLNCN